MGTWFWRVVYIELLVYTFYIGKTHITKLTHTHPNEWMMMTSEWTIYIYIYTMWDSFKFRFVAWLALRLGVLMFMVLCLFLCAICLSVYVSQYIFSSTEILWACGWLTNFTCRSIRLWLRYWKRYHENLR